MLSIEISKNYFQSILSNNSIKNKSVILAGDFIINVLGLEENKKVQKFINSFF